MSSSSPHNRTTAKAVYLVSLGCARNQVDSEEVLGQFAANGWRITDEPDEADAIVVNTCSFIESAVQESIDTILALAERKTKGTCQRLVVAGCLPQRYQTELTELIPEVDAFIGTGAYFEVVAAAEPDNTKPVCLLPDPDRRTMSGSVQDREIDNPHSVYLKIAEGCDRHCTYCIIPKLRGRQKSRSMKVITQEAQKLAQKGTSELIVVAQESTAYGSDLGGAVNLATLLTALAEKLPSTWLRVLYGHPDSITDEMISVMARWPNICTYFDLPIQHASDAVLKKMGRQSTMKALQSVFERIRTIAPRAALRTTVITGFPGETEDDFEKLKRFVQTIKFNHLGVFTYSDAVDLPSHHLPNHVPEKVAADRRDELMLLQQAISKEQNEAYLNQTLPVLIETAPEDGFVCGRTQFQAPEVDGVTDVRIGRKTPPIGAIVPVRITDAMEYDLSGEME
jgi:ribosomal protein S12 methylthiotransferase